MYRAYLGNLDPRVAEETLLSLFREHSLSPTSIQVRRGFAFVDCPDQQTLDRTIDKLNGKIDQWSTCSVCGIDMSVYFFIRTPRSMVLQWHAQIFKMAGRPRRHAGHHKLSFLTSTRTTGLRAFDMIMQAYGALGNDLYEGVELCTCMAYFTG